MTDQDFSVVMYDTSIKNISEIIVGDVLLSPESLPKKVVRITETSAQLYKILQVTGDPYIVSKFHILSLKCIRTPSMKHDPIRGVYLVSHYTDSSDLWGKTFKHGRDAVDYMEKIDKNPIVNISIMDYIKKSDTWKQHWVGYKVAIEFPFVKTVIDPYMFGLWLGAGMGKNERIFLDNPEIIKYVQQVDIQPCVFLEELKRLNLLNNKHIPDIYKYNSLETRFKLLAGIIDTMSIIDKNPYYTINNRIKPLVNDILFIARSLGFCADIGKQSGAYYKGKYHFQSFMSTRIARNSETSFDKLPILVRHKPKVQEESWLISKLRLIPLYTRIYNKYELEDNSKFLLSDFTVSQF